MKRRQIFAIVLVVVAVFVVTMAMRGVVLGGVSQTTLATAQPVSGAVTQSLASSSASGINSAIGHGFTVQTTVYLDSHTWAVAVINQTSDGNTATVVLQKVNGAYQVVLGPGTAFSTSDVQLMPADVVAYLTDRGLVSSASYNE